jgi:hypothetical protein
MKVSILQQQKVNGIDVSTVITVETERGELSKAEVIAMVQLLSEERERPYGNAQQAKG